MKNISLIQMFKELEVSIINKVEPDTYYYKREDCNGNNEYVQITEVDLMSSRYRTVDDDFSEFEWEMENSNIYKDE